MIATARKCPECRQPLKATPNLANPARKALAAELRMWHHMRTTDPEHRWAALFALNHLAESPAFSKEGK